MIMKSKLKILSFYRFIKINEKKKLKVRNIIGKKTVEELFYFRMRVLMDRSLVLTLIIINNKILKKILKIKN